MTKLVSFHSRKASRFNFFFLGGGGVRYVFGYVTKLAIRSNKMDLIYLDM
jgi:hypothetical protein